MFVLKITVTEMKKQPLGTGQPGTLASLPTAAGTCISTMHPRGQNAREPRTFFRAHGQGILRKQGPWECQTALYNQNG